MAQGTETTLERLSLTSADISAELKEALGGLFPGAFDEQGKLDFGRLKELLGEYADGDKSRYGLSWAGKQDAKRALLSQSVGTLAPMRGESVDFDETGNLIIEGDNLEVLKLLQKAYYGKVKMIYIDPPYNTGNDFIYPDNFREGLQDYLKYSGQVSDEGFRISSNTETSGRYHSNWLNMMYPRLALARNLLREDGVIFVSIDDHEVHNLRMLIDEVFGEENLIGQFVWKSRQNKDNRNVTGASIDHEYVLCYGRRVRGASRETSQYSNPDNDPRGDWTSANMVGILGEDKRPNCHYDLTNPATGLTYPKPKLGWRYDRTTMARLIEDDRILWPPDPAGRPRRKVFLSELQAEFTGYSSVIASGVYTRDGTAELDALFRSRVMEFPKPVKLLRELCEQGAHEPDAIILDFFAGSGTTAQAVMELNQEDGGNRRFILVQLPEPLDPPIRLDDGTKLTTIADICRERVRRAAKKIAAKSEGKLDMGESKHDLGFRAFKLTSSNFKLWEDNTEGDTEKLKEQLKLYAENVLPDRDPEWVLYEVLLKSGVELSANVERIEGETFSVDGGRLIVCLDDPVEEARLRELIESGAEKIVCLDHGFQGNDALKANIAQQVKQWNSHHPEKPVEFRTV